MNEFIRLTETISQAGVPRHDNCVHFPRCPGQQLYKFTQLKALARIYPVLSHCLYHI